MVNWRMREIGISTAIYDVLLAVMDVELTPRHAYEYEYRMARIMAKMTSRKARENNLYVIMRDFQYKYADLAGLGESSLSERKQEDVYSDGLWAVQRVSFMLTKTASERASLELKASMQWDSIPFTREIKGK